jgi:hypothetical protein
MVVNNFLSPQSFLNQGCIELKRSERYRVFVTLVLFHLGFVRELFDQRAEEIMRELAVAAQSNIRSSDMITTMNGSIAVLIPETPRQGAEVTSRRLGDLLRRRLGDFLQGEVDQIIPMEIASYPDTAGARKLAEFLDELAEKHLN